VASFAEQNLDVDDRRPFAAHLEAGGVSRQFPKNLDLIKSKLRRLQYAFASGVRVTAPADDLDAEVLNIAGLPDGRSHLEVTDNLNGITTRG